MKSIFFDVDTQLDFLMPAGALYVPGAEEIAPALATLTSFAAKNSIQIVSTLDSHPENDPEFRLWKPHCIVGTQGRQKYSRTLLERPSAAQIILEKNTIDFFADEKSHRLLDEIRAERFVVYGLVSEHCVRAAVLGLLERKARVELVTDAIKSLSAASERAVLEEFTARGGRLTTVGQVISEAAAA